MKLHKCQIAQDYFNLKVQNILIVFSWNWSLALWGVLPRGYLGDPRDVNDCWNILLIRSQRFLLKDANPFCRIECSLLPKLNKAHVFINKIQFVCMVMQESRSRIADKCAFGVNFYPYQIYCKQVVRLDFDWWSEPSFWVNARDASCRDTTPIVPFNFTH